MTKLKKGSLFLLLTIALAIALAGAITRANEASVYVATCREKGGQVLSDDHCYRWSGGKAFRVEGM